jgi:hypothetical protein
MEDNGKYSVCVIGNRISTIWFAGRTWSHTLNLEGEVDGWSFFNKPVYHFAS